MKQPLSVNEMLISLGSKQTTLKGKAVAPERMTNYEVDPKHGTQLVVPSFGTAGALFARHFDILSTVKRRVYLLRQAYES